MLSFIMCDDCGDRIWKGFRGCSGGMCVGIGAGCRGGEGDGRERDGCGFGSGFDGVGVLGVLSLCVCSRLSLVVMISRASC